MLKGICKVCEKENVFNYLYQLREDKRYKIYKCTNCGFEFLYPTPNLSDIFEIYNNSNYPAHYISEEVEKAKKKNFKNILNIAKRFLISNEVNFLDIGAGLGYAMEVAQELGWRSYGIEISKNAYTFLEKKFDKDKIFNCDFLDFKTDIKFDIITMFDVLEHFFNPIDVIRKTYEISNSSSILIINTPNTSSFSAKLLKKNWPHYNIEHLSYFNKKNITLILENKFKILEAKHLIEWITPEYFINQLNRYNTHNIFTKFIIPITNIILPLPITGEMLVILKKITL